MENDVNFPGYYLINPKIIMRLKKSIPPKPLKLIYKQ